MTHVPDDKPSPCRACGGRAGVEHITEPERPAGIDRLREKYLLPIAPPARRYAQVICRICDARGPRVMFDVSDEWPHIAAERDAVADWNCLHRVTQCS